MRQASRTREGVVLTVAFARLSNRELGIHAADWTGVRCRQDRPSAGVQSGGHDSRSRWVDEKMPSPPRAVLDAGPVNELGRATALEEWLDGVLVAW
jgi:hypothetical protein